MARFFPARSQCQFDTPGERRFAERLEKLLEDDYLCWSNVPVGPKARYPDFVVLHPRRGILVLEVKDWKLATLESITPNEVRLHTQDRLKTQTNPFLQAYVCVLKGTIAYGAQSRANTNVIKTQPKHKSSLIQPSYLNHKTTR